jgi:hypothetical protein
MTNSIQIGTGAGYAGDRITPAVELASHPPLDYLVFECLAERTIANAQLRKLENSNEGYTPLLDQRWKAVLPHCLENDITVVTNMGAANPVAALDQTVEIATDLGLTDLTVASVSGSDLLTEFEKLHEHTQAGEATTNYKADAVSANAYMGVDGIIEALEADADVIITGRVADPSLFLAPICYEFGWDLTVQTREKQQQIGQGIVCAHLMECAGQITGGYFADPKYKDVEDLAHLGFPIATVSTDGNVEISKLPNSGGQVTVRTCKEQLLYEVHDPSAYITPDAVADFSSVSFNEVDSDQVRVAGANAHPRPDTLKVNIGYEDSIVGEGQVSYAGPGAVERARLAGEVVRERLKVKDMQINDLRIDHIGLDSLHEGQWNEESTPYEIRLRVAGKCDREEDAANIGQEVQTLYTNGPAGGGGATMETKQVIGIVSTLVDRDYVEPIVEIQEV